MFRTSWLVKAARLQIYQITYYNRRGQDDIRRRNIAAFRILGVGGFFITLLTFAVLVPLGGLTQVMWRYWPLILLYAAKWLFGEICSRTGTKSNALVGAGGAVLSCLLLALLAFIGIHWYPDRTDSLFCFALLLIPVFFYGGTTLTVSINVCAGVLYCVGVYYFKSPAVVMHDIYTAAVSTLLSLVVFAYHAQLRANWFIVKERYKRLSRTDLLTTLLNKCSYEAHCQKLLCEMEPDEPCALAIFDLDTFKHINDTYGHAIGDRVLELTGQALAAHFRIDGLVGRIGGDEFSAFVYTRRGVELLARRAENVVMEVKERAIKELRIDVTMSVGLAANFHGPVDFSELYLKADEDMYRHKHSPHSERRRLAAVK